MGDNVYLKNDNDEEKFLFYMEKEKCSTHNTVPVVYKGLQT